VFQNTNLIPELIVNLVSKFKNTRDVNERFQLELRLNDILKYINAALREKKNVLN
jgi:hypothetical protein